TGPYVDGRDVAPRVGPHGPEGTTRIDGSSGHGEACRTNPRARVPARCEPGRRVDRGEAAPWLHANAVEGTRDVYRGSVHRDGRNLEGHGARVGVPGRREARGRIECRQAATGLPSNGREGAPDVD